MAKRFEVNVKEEKIWLWNLIKKAFTSKWPIFLKILGFEPSYLIKFWHFLIFLFLSFDLFLNISNPRALKFEIYFFIKHILSWNTTPKRQTHVQDISILTKNYSPCHRPFCVFICLIYSVVSRMKSKTHGMCMIIWNIFQSNVRKIYCSIGGILCVVIIFIPLLPKKKS